MDQTSYQGREETREGAGSLDNKLADSERVFHPLTVPKRQTVARDIDLAISSIPIMEKALRIHLCQAIIHLLEEKTRSLAKGELVKALTEVDKLKKSLEEIANRI